MMDDRRFEVPAGWAGTKFLGESPFGTDLVRSHPDGASVIRFLDGKRATAPGVWSSPTGKLIRFFPDAVDALWTPDGKHLVVVTVPGAVRVAVLAWPELAVKRDSRMPFETGSGVGGLELSITASGRHGSLWIYSGQSEEGFLLFSLPGLATLASLPYVAGESATPCLFSPDEQYLALVLEPFAYWWAGDGDHADADTPAKGGPVHWATLYLQEVGEQGRCTEHKIFVDLPRGWVPNEDLQAASWPRNVRFKDAQHLVFNPPWGGECRIPVPPTEACFAPPPQKG